MSYSVWDCETGPLPDDQLNRLMPKFEPPANYTNEEKIAAWLKDKQADWKDKAALSALTGRVLAIGIRYSTGVEVIMQNDDDEAQILRDFWHDCLNFEFADLWVGHNIIGFDLPFLMRRSMLLGVPVPHVIRPMRYFDPRFIDTMEKWDLGTHERISLDTLSKALGVGAKSGSGKDFAKLWREDRDAALAYLRHDLELTEKCALKMRCIPESGPKLDVVAVKSEFKLKTVRKRKAEPDEDVPFSAGMAAAVAAEFKPEPPKAVTTMAERFRAEMERKPAERQILSDPVAAPRQPLNDPFTMQEPAKVVAVEQPEPAGEGFCVQPFNPDFTKPFISLTEWMKREGIAMDALMAYCRKTKCAREEFTNICLAKPKQALGDLASWKHIELLDTREAVKAAILKKSVLATPVTPVIQPTA